MAGSSDGQKLLEYCFGRKLPIPIIEIVFHQPLLLFLCGNQANTVRDKITFAFSVTYHVLITKTRHKSKLVL